MDFSGLGKRKDNIASWMAVSGALIRLHALEERYNAARVSSILEKRHAAWICCQHHTVRHNWYERDLNRESRLRERQVSLQNLTISSWIESNHLIAVCYGERTNPAELHLKESLTIVWSQKARHGCWQPIPQGFVNRSFWGHSTAWEDCGKKEVLHFE